jgi:hypothetical protein
MIELYTSLYVGDQSTCAPGYDGLAVVHACKSPCHQAAMGYRVASHHDERYYLAFRGLHNLYLNLIGPPTPLFRVEPFRHFRDFAASTYVDGQLPLLIHCNQGQSRAPSLALLFRAKDLHVLPDDSYTVAAEAFAPLAAKLPRYAPGQGIQQFLAELWTSAR